MQLPGIDNELAFKLSKEAQVNDISDFMNMEDDLRDKILKVDENRMQILATICNRYPIVNLSYDVLSKTAADPVVQLDITLSREEDEEDPDALAVFNEPI